MITYCVQQLPKNICLEDLRNLMPKRALIDDLIRPRFVIKLLCLSIKINFCKVSGYCERSR